MRKTRKAFTLLETVVTIGILAIAFGLAGVLVSQIVTLQNKSTDEIVLSDQRATLDDFVADYVSFISVDTDELSFSYKSSDDNTITFTAELADSSTYDYSILFVGQILTVRNNYPDEGENAYLKYQKSVRLADIQSIAFSFDTEIGLLKTTALSSEGFAWNSVHIVRAG